MIVPTNFDRLVERALEDEGVSPHVIRNPSDVAGMSPLSHAPATVIKLHGDYADLLMRNTVDELDTYPDEWNQLLDRIRDLRRRPAVLHAVGLRWRPNRLVSRVEIEDEGERTPSQRAEDRDAEPLPCHETPNRNSSVLTPC